MQTRAEFVRDSIKVVRSLYRKGNFVDALKGCRELLNFAPGDVDVLALKEKVEFAFVRSQLPFRKTFLKAQEYEKLYAFYQKLYRICPHVPEVVRLMSHCERLIEKKRVQEQSVVIKEIEQKISSDFKAHRWERVRDECYQILKIDSRHSFALNMIARTSRAETREANKILHEKLPVMRHALIQDYAKAPEKFHRI